MTILDRKSSKPRHLVNIDAVMEVIAEFDVPVTRLELSEKDDFASQVRRHGRHRLRPDVCVRLFACPACTCRLVQWRTRAFLSRCTGLG